MTIGYRFLILILDDMLDQLIGAFAFSKIDLKSGYHHIRVKNDNAHTTIFYTIFGQYEYLVLPFDLTNAPATFIML